MGYELWGLLAQPRGEHVQMTQFNMSHSSFSSAHSTCENDSWSQEEGKQFQISYVYFWSFFRYFMFNPRGGKNNWFLDESWFGRGWFWIDSQMSKNDFLHVNWQRNADRTQEAPRQSMVCTQQKTWDVSWMSVLTNNSWVEQSEAFVYAKRLESGVETAFGCWLLAVSC